MALPTPQITLTTNLESILAGAAENGFLEITLCGFGPVPPTVEDELMIADAGVPQLVGPGNNPSVALFGNDVIEPAGTFYMIAVLDANRNVIQAANYILTGDGTQNLASLTPVINPPYNVPSGYVVIDPATGTVTLNPMGWTGPITFDLTLTGNVTINTGGFYPGQRVQLIIRQDGTGGRTVTFNATTIHNAAAVQTDADTISTQELAADNTGNFYPPSGWQ